MTSIAHTFQKRSTGSLPVSQAAAAGSSEPAATVLRRRLSSLSLNLKPAYSSPAASWGSFCRSRSVSSLGELAGGSIKKWWAWGWAWILSRKLGFAEDLEMNEEESRMLGSQSKGSLKHVFFKLRRLVGSQNIGLPQTCKYTPTSFDYAKSYSFRPESARTQMAY